MPEGPVRRPALALVSMPSPITRGLSFAGASSLIAPPQIGPRLAFAGSTVALPPSRVRYVRCTAEGAPVTSQTSAISAGRRARSGCGQSPRKRRAGEAARTDSPRAAK